MYICDYGASHLSHDRMVLYIEYLWGYSEREKNQDFLSKGYTSFFAS